MIARRFNGGMRRKMDKPRRDGRGCSRSDSAVPSGLVRSGAEPGDKSPGYCRMSLRDGSESDWRRLFGDCCSVNVGEGNSPRTHQKSETGLADRSDFNPVPLLGAFRWFQVVGSVAFESQRDSATEPRVARDELPWGYSRKTSSTPKVLRPFRHVRRNPVGVEFVDCNQPRVGNPLSREANPGPQGGIPLGYKDLKVNLMGHAQLLRGGRRGAP